MSTTYTYSITDCYKNPSGIISSLVVTWIGTKEEDGVTYTAEEISHIGLDAAGDNPIPFTDLDEATLKSWYDSKLKTKLTIIDVEGNYSDDTLTIEERCKDTLDTKLEGEILAAKLKKDNEANVMNPGLPY
tara:strand:+ start:2161 stop:2553 length:393 start_codon:yes stop_codon:yes gene_type:complete